MRAIAVSVGLHKLFILLGGRNIPNATIGTMEDNTGRIARRGTNANWSAAKRHGSTAEVNPAAVIAAVIAVRGRTVLFTKFASVA